MICEIEIWIGRLEIWLGNFWAQVGVCFDICNRSQTRYCCEGMRSCHNGMNLIRQPEPSIHAQCIRIESEAHADANTHEDVCSE